MSSLRTAIVGITTVNPRPRFLPFEAWTLTMVASALDFACEVSSQAAEAVMPQLTALMVRVANRKTPPAEVLQ